VWKCAAVNQGEDETRSTMNGLRPLSKVVQGLIYVCVSVTSCFVQAKMT